MAISTCQLVTKVISGDTALEWFKTYHNERILIICDKFLNDNGTIELITRNIDDSNTLVIFDGTVPDPPLEVIAEGVKAAAKLQPTVLVGFGGGAAIDSAKGVVYFAHHGNVVKQKPTFIAIPTTSGTGSEMTAFAVFTDNAEHSKIALIDDLMYADIAILDPHLTVTVPPAITANTGFDVITHATEAYVAKSAADFTDGVACKALELAIQALPKCYHFGANLTARKDMLSASNMAGIAFNLGGLGMIHSMAHQLGGMFHIPHGLACAMCLPIGIAYNSQDPDIEAKYADLAYKIGVAPRTMDTKLAVQTLCTVFKALMTDMDMATRVGELTKNPISRETYEAAIPQMAENAVEDRCLPENPRTVTKADFIELFKKAY